MSARNLKGDVMDYKSLLSIIPVGKENYERYIACDCSYLVLVEYL